MAWPIVPPELDGITIGQNIAAVIKAREIPVDRDNPTVSNSDSGHVWTWTQKDGTLERLTTDDDGVVQMIDILATPANQQWITAPIAGSLQFNGSGHINAQPDDLQPDLFKDEWLPLANRAGTVLGYVIQPDYGILFAFPAPGDQGLIEVLTGTRGALYSTGLIPSQITVLPCCLINRVPLRLQPATISRDVFEAPELVQDPAGRGFVRGFVVYVRVDVGSDGMPSGASVFADSGGSEVDKAAIYRALHQRFQPATINGKPIRSIFFERQAL